MQQYEIEQNEREKRVSNRITLGLAGAVLAAISTPLWGPLVSPDKKQDVAAYVQPASEEHPRGSPGLTYLPLNFGEGRNLELVLAPNPDEAGFTFVSATLTIDEKARADWARYAPVRLIIPELSYVQPFAVEHGERVLFSNLNHPISRRLTLHYMLAGRDPATGRACEVAKHALNFGGRQK
jgi:hypothetical protein